VNQNKIKEKEKEKKKRKEKTLCIITSINCANCSKSIVSFNF